MFSNKYKIKSVECTKCTNNRIIVYMCTLYSYMYKINSLYLLHLQYIIILNDIIFIVIKIIHILILLKAFIFDLTFYSYKKLTSTISITCKYISSAFIN